MKYAIVEVGGKQYKTVEGETIQVDRLPGEPGEELSLERVLMLVDGESVNVGQPTVGGMVVQVTIDKHFRGEKVVAFRYSPKKRIRVRRGQRHEYTRLMVDAIAEAGAARGPKKAKKAATRSEAKKEADDLVKIEGIGPKAAQALNEAGIVTFAQLAESGVEDLLKILSDAGLKSLNPETWMEQAQLAADGDWEAFEKLQAELTGGRKTAKKK
jgi:large subunit ribosomal protein L21